jgi:probable HAF family extracellular repeat protein
MKKRGLIAAVVLIYSLALMQGCSSDDSSAALVNNIPADDSQNTGGGGGGGTIVVGDLGELTDLGDGLFPAGDHWYSTRARAINGQGIVIGETNWGVITTSGAFKWDPTLPVDQAMTFLGIHMGNYFDYEQLVPDPDPETHYFAFSEAVDINGSGAIIGNSLTGHEGEKRAFIWNNGVFADLPPIIGKYSEVADINEKNEVVLTLEDDLAGQHHAYYWDGITTPPVYDQVGTIVGTTSEAVAINENGQVLMNSGGTALFFDRNWAVLEELNHLPGANLTIAVDLNDSIYTNNDGIPDGHAIGNSGIASSNFNKAQMEAFLNNSYLEADAGMTVANLGEVQGFFWDGGAMYPVNHLGGGKSVAADLNNKDQVVGGALTAEGATHAILWTLGSDKKGIIRDLGTLGGVNSMALAINEAGQVVGWSETGAFYQEQGVVMPIRHGFLWDNGRMYDLGTHDNFYDYPFKPPYPFSEAVDINESGALTGNSITINDHSRGFYLQPEIPAP